MSSQPRTSKNTRNRQHYNKSKSCTCNKSNNNKLNCKCKRQCNSCININININNGSGNTGSTGGTDCDAVNDRCNEQLAACYKIVGNNRVGRLACIDGYNNCFLNAGCQQPAQGGGGGDSPDNCRDPAGLDRCISNRGCRSIRDQTEQDRCFARCTADNCI